MNNETKVDRIAKLATTVAILDQMGMDFTEPRMELKKSFRELLEAQSAVKETTVKAIQNLVDAAFENDEKKRQGRISRAKKALIKTLD